jgi:hypothetical protein
MVLQLLKMDDDTRGLIGKHLPMELTPFSTALQSPYLFHIDPIVFTHAYMLMGTHASRFGYDLSLYLSTVNTFFNRNPLQETIRIPNTSQDAKRRLSEDLGVALASLFMVKALNIQWPTISQIPMNNKLAKKRPDFEGFNTAGKRFLFEAKGTTNPSNVETALGHAIEQVKGYPEEAERKLAIVSFFSTDPRLFDSATFVVDPPLPDIVPPDEETSVLLHYEKVLQFCGYANSAVEYLKLLGRYLKEERELYKEGISHYAPAPEVTTLTNLIKQEGERFGHRVYKGRAFRGQVLTHEIGKKVCKIFLGIAEDKLFEIQNFFNNSGEPSQEWQDDGVSVFSDGTVLEVTIK